MFKYDNKILVSGCGISFSGQDAKTWVNILSLTGMDIVDVGAPAVSNQWILNRAFMQLETDPEIKQVIVQLTAIGKLDVEVNADRIRVLVAPDSVRNFTVDDIWPSSFSCEHESKRLWQQWLYSPSLEKQDVVCKLKLLKHWCDTQKIRLLVVQGYDMKWNATEKEQLSDIIQNIEYNIIEDYKNTEWHKQNPQADVPVLEYQIKLAKTIAESFCPDLEPHLEKIQNKLI